MVQINNKWFFLNNNFGISLMETLVVMAVSGIITTGATYIALESQKVEKNQAKIFWLQEQRLALLKATQGKQNWDRIKSENPNMACFNNNTSCAAFITPQSLILRVGSTMLDGSSGANGLNDVGNFCSNFNSNTGNANCPIGLNLTWQALCNDTACRLAQPKIEINFSMNDPRERTRLNLDSYRIIAFGDVKLQNTNDLCTKMGGVMIGTSCQITALSSKCDPANDLGLGATFPLGFDANGNVICGKPVLSECSSTQVMYGFDSNGNILCTSKCSTAGTNDNCQGSWGSCNSITGKETYTVTTPKTGTGSNCPAADNDTRDCDVDCKGRPTGACFGVDPGAYRIFTITVPKKNGGADCTHLDGGQHPSDCNISVPSGRTCDRATPIAPNSTGACDPPWYSDGIECRYWCPIGAGKEFVAPNLCCDI